ncbi:hypothetical protein ACN38_g11578 [Penicillium nordicum]|uniref:Uncharacterized protein n=1 Tax=Penicillium nordicum TaxID=229535 RepID=A0A0M9WAN3_9EURO|nr:hypothetical protein ACN38_g11578 [Penicillium nordicum]
MMPYNALENIYKEISKKTTKKTTKKTLRRTSKKEDLVRCGDKIGCKALANERVKSYVTAIPVVAHRRGRGVPAWPGYSQQYRHLGYRDTDKQCLHPLC